MYIALIRNTLIVGLLVLFFAFVPTVDSAQYVINYQGILSDSGGTPVTDPSVSMIFRIYDAPTGGTLLWEESQIVVVTNGVYNVLLGDGTPSVGTFGPLIFSGAERYLEIEVNSEVLAPRSRITSVAQSFHALDSEHALSADDADTVGGMTPAALDQSAHLLDQGNPHHVTALQLNTVTQSQLSAAVNLHQNDAAAHHIKTTSFSELTSGTIVTGQIADGAVTNAKISGPIVGAKISSAGLNSDTVDSFHAAQTPVSNTLLPLGTDQKFPNTVLHTGTGNGLDADLLDNLHAADIIDAATDEVRLPISSVPTVITQPGSYYFTGNLHLAATDQNAIEVQAEDVTIDLMGFTLSGPGTGQGNYGAGIFVYSDNVEIRNGTIRDFTECGIEGGGGRVQVYNMQILFNGDPSYGNYGGINLERGIIQHSIIRDNNGPGISAQFYVQVLDNVIANNTGTGIDAGFYCLIRENHVFDNNHSGDGYGAGIVAHQSCNIQNNTLTQNRMNSIFLWEYGNMVEGNFMADSDTGIRFEMTGNFYTGNRLTGHTTPYLNPAGNVDGGGNFIY